MSLSKTEPWYKDGLRFRCTQCGACCSGEPGFVWITESEMSAMAKALELELELFRKRFIRRVGGRYSLVEYPDGDCIFLDPDTRGCLVYSVRPVQCRTWPFWNSNLRTEADWQATCELCPGAGKGKLYNLETIDEQRKKKRV